jgi:DNA-binding MarR family transcriptional regulator
VDTEEVKKFAKRLGGSPGIALYIYACGTAGYQRGHAFLADEMGVERSSMPVLLKRMEKSGWIKRSVITSDQFARVHVIYAVPLAEAA